MAIHLITGVPGAGKSLRAVWQCVERIKSDLEQDRPVFGNVRGFKRQAPLPGSRYQNDKGEFEDIPGEWMDCPDGSIIMIDECQERWRRYRGTGEPPAEIAALERHRHRNIDFILTCQNPQQLSADVRALVETHEHLTKRGKGMASVWRWSGRCSTSPSSNRRDPDCEIEIWRYPKWIFKEYVSANEHTVRNKIPRLAWIALGMMIFIPVSMFFAYKQVSGLFDEPEPYVATNTVSSNQAGASSFDSPVIEVRGSSVDQVEAAGGIVKGDDCRLYDQQGKRILVTWADCMNAMEIGFPYAVTPVMI